MLPDTSENICVLEKQLRAIFLLAKRSPEGKLPFVRRQQFFQIGDNLFMRLLRDVYKRQVSTSATVGLSLAQVRLPAALTGSFTAES